MVIDRDKITSKMKNIIIDRLGVESQDIKEESSFTEDLDADSVDLIDLIVEFEREFDIEVPDNEMDGIKTVKDAIDYVFEHQK